MKRATLLGALVTWACGLAAVLGALPAGAGSPGAPDCGPAPGAISQLVGQWRARCVHPLCGSILSLSPANAPASIGASEAACPAGSWGHFIGSLEATLNGGGVLLLGEVHDNAEHHRFRALMLAGAKAVVLEQLSAEEQPATYVNSPAAGASETAIDEFFERTGWTKGGWPTDIYRPLVGAIVAQSLPVYAGDPPKDRLRDLARGSAGALSSVEQTRLVLHEPLASELNEAALQEIEAAHCGVMPASAFTGMAAAQRYRDAHLADVTLRAASTHGNAILITGNNHVRTDRGVPWYLARRAPERRSISVMLVEAEEGRDEPESYIARDPHGKAAADFVIFTPSTEREDPCERMRAMKKGGAG